MRYLLARSLALGSYTLYAYDYQQYTQPSELTFAASFPLNIFRGNWSNKTTAATASSRLSTTRSMSSTDILDASSTASPYSFLLISIDLFEVLMPYQHFWSVSEDCINHLIIAVLGRAISCWVGTSLSHHEWSSARRVRLSALDISSRLFQVDGRWWIWLYFWVTDSWQITACLMTDDRGKELGLGSLRWPVNEVHQYSY